MNNWYWMKTIDCLVESTSQYIHLSLKHIKMLTYDSIVCANVYFSWALSKQQVLIFLKEPLFIKHQLYCYALKFDFPVIAMKVCWRREPSVRVPVKTIQPAQLKHLWVGPKRCSLSCPVEGRPNHSDPVTPPPVTTLTDTWSTQWNAEQHETIPVLIRWLHYNFNTLFLLLSLFAYSSSFDTLYFTFSHRC